MCSGSSAIKNGIRKHLGFAVYEDPTTNIVRHPIIATVIPGLEYARPLSPLTRIVGAHVGPEDSPLSEADEVALQWLR